jgi:glycosyltransferase involved in cell wall biosynthesis
VERPVYAGPLRLVTVGRLVEVKGFDLLVRALGGAVHDGLDATLTIVGAGPERSRLEALVAENNLGARITFAGALGEEALLGKLAEADAFVSASRKEGFGVAIVEALATGLPVLATLSGGPDEIVTEDDGMLVAPDDIAALSAALLGLASGIARYDRAAIAARALERYGPGRVGAKLMDVYRSVAAGEPLPTTMEATR